MTAQFARAARSGATSDRCEAVRDLWPTAAGPNVLAWSYADDDPECHTIYTVFVAHPGGTPFLQFAFDSGDYSLMPIEKPERFGEWDTPRKFKKWARAWKDDKRVE